MAEQLEKWDLVHVQGKRGRLQSMSDDRRLAVVELEDGGRWDGDIGHIHLVPAKERMDEVELKEIRELSLGRVKVSCDEAHAHSRECLAGDPRDLTVLRLCDQMLREKKELGEALQTLKKIGTC